MWQLLDETRCVCVFQECPKPTTDHTQIIHSMYDLYKSCLIKIFSKPPKKSDMKVLKTHRVSNH